MSTAKTLLADDTIAENVALMVQANHELFDNHVACYAVTLAINEYRDVILAAMEEVGE